VDLEVDVLALPYVMIDAALLVWALGVVCPHSVGIFLDNAP
jgi:hypothetical protein